MNNKYTYQGPHFKNGHIDRFGKLHNPNKMTDAEIEKFIAQNPSTKNWWKINKASTTKKSK